MRDSVDSAFFSFSVRLSCSFLLNPNQQKNLPISLDGVVHIPKSAALSLPLARKIRDFRNTEGLAMVQIRYRGGFETKSEAFT